LVVRSVPDCEGGGKGEWLSGEERVWRRRAFEEGEAGRRVQEVQTQRSGFTDGRFAENLTPERGVRFHARISSFTVGPRKSARNVQVSREVDRPVTIKARVIE
jgi:hypothetical protein